MKDGAGRGWAQALARGQGLACGRVERRVSNMLPGAGRCCSQGMCALARAGLAAGARAAADRAAIEHNPGHLH